jgi:hypothetical protein
MARLSDKVAIVAGAGSIAEGWSNGKATELIIDGGQIASTTGKIWED